MFCLDCETLGVDSDSAVLSIALIHFDENKKYTFQKLVENSCFVKFDVQEQIRGYKRTIDKETVEWWKKQSKVAKDYSLTPSGNDISLLEGIEILQKYVKEHSSVEKEVVWIRGSLDQFVLDHLFKSAGKEVLFAYSQYLDMRTAIYLLKETNNGGYCPVPGLDMNSVYKHLPDHDCALDIMMLLDGV